MGGTRPLGKSGDQPPLPGGVEEGGGSSLALAQIPGATLAEIPLLNKLRAFMLRGRVRAIVGQTEPQRSRTLRDELLQ